MFLLNVPGLARSFSSAELPGQINRSRVLLSAGILYSIKALPTPSQGLVDVQKLGGPLHLVSNLGPTLRVCSL